MLGFVAASWFGSVAAGRCYPTVAVQPDVDLSSRVRSSHSEHRLDRLSEFVRRRYGEPIWMPQSPVAASVESPAALDWAGGALGRLDGVQVLGADCTLYPCGVAVRIESGEQDESSNGTIAQQLDAIEERVRQAAVAPEGLQAQAIYAGSSTDDAGKVSLMGTVFLVPTGGLTEAQTALLRRRASIISMDHTKF